MKIAITGHSKGLGAELAQAYHNLGHEVIGFSRSNGYDLRNWSMMQKMIDQILDFDIFVNIAKPDFVQTTVLYELWKRWKDQSRTIINISSGIAYLPCCPKNLFDDPAMDAYRTAKIALNEASAQLSHKAHWPKIVVVNPWHLYSDPMTEHDKQRLQAWVKVFLSISTTIQDNGFRLSQITF